MFDVKQELPKAPLYREEFEHDNCGIGACVNIHGEKSRATVENALKIVENLEHRAGKDAEGKTGDGVGILTQIPHKFFARVTRALGMDIGGEREYGVGMFFFPQEELRRNQAKKMFEIIVEKEGMEFLGWREVPTFPNVLGHKAVECMPYIMQGFVKKPADVEKGLPFDRRLYIARRVFEQSSDDTYVVSLSSRTIVYKGMFLVGQLRTFFADLQSEDYESAIAMVHSRFSTNTNPSWERAHPNRLMVHNGEINTIRGNADKMLAREENMESEHLKGQLHKVLPAISKTGSDSAMLDNTLEFLVMSGMELPLAVMIAIPEPWANNKAMSQTKRDFYQYYATMMEPWDGPASILFSDGDIMGAVLDRNGLRPSRYMITDDDTLMGWIIDASPMGMMVLTEYLDEWGMKSPETFDELLDVCNEILEEELLPEETGLLMQKYTQSGMMDLFMKYYIMTSLQEGRRLDFTDETFLHYVQRIKDELPAEEEPRMAFENIFMIPGASSAPSQMIQFVPRIFPEQNSAVETYVTIAVVNPYGKNQEAAIQFLEYCATHLTDGSYFIYDNLTEPIENPSMVAQLDELAEKIALLEQKADKERADEDTLRDLQDQYANMEQWRYFSSAEDIAYYQEMAKSLYVSEGSPLTYDDALQVLVQRYLNGAFDAATFAKECQNHVEMIYAEIGE